MDESPPQQSAPVAAHEAKNDHKKVMSILAYIGILIIIPFLMAKDQPEVKFHIKQGLVLFIGEVILWVLGTTMLGWQLWPILQLINLGIAVLAIIGIINAVKGRQVELPLVGSLAKNFTF